MNVYEHVSEFAAPHNAVAAMVMGPGGFLRFSPAGLIRVTEGNPDDVRVGSQFTVKAIPAPFLSFLGSEQTIRVARMDDTAQVMEQVQGPLRGYRHEMHLSDLPDGGTRLHSRLTFEQPRMIVDVTEALSRQMRFQARQMRGDLALHQNLAGRTRKVLIAGASGLIGTQLAALLANAGQEVVRLVRSPDDGYAVGSSLRWDPTSGSLPSGALDGVDAVINLSGETIGGRFKHKRKQAILQSRLDATGTLAAAVAAHPNTALIQASAIGIYGPRRPGEVLTEDASVGTGFLADVVRQWEGAAQPAVDAGARVALLRTGIVLSQAGGALAPQVPLFLAGVGGRLANKHAITSWIGVDDVARVYAHALATPLMQGPVNMVGPEPVTHQEFADTLARVLRRRAWLPVPPIGPKALLGSEGHDQLIDTDQRVNSAKLEATGFQFAEPTVEEALAHTLMR